MRGFAVNWIQTAAFPSPAVPVHVVSGARAAVNTKTGNSRCSLQDQKGRGGHLNVDVRGVMSFLCEPHTNHLLEQACPSCIIILLSQQGGFDRLTK